MAPAPPHPLLGLDAARFAELARTALQGGKGAGAARAVYRRAMATGTLTPEADGLGPRAAALLRQHFALDLPTVAAMQHEPDSGTHKVLLQLHDGARIECVHLAMGRGRSSLCLSTQVGCARGCTFCETARMGLQRNLTAAEIVGQVVAARTVLGWPADNLVFMGMGEPLDNLPGLRGALAVLLDGGGLGYAQDRVTVCTVGHVPGILALRALGLRRLGLHLSLNAADDGLRRQLMPIAARHPLAELQRALQDYRMRPNLTLGIHWCLLPGINDGEGDAAAVARFCKPLGRCLVHVIPYNPGTAPIARAPSDAEVATFVGRLRAHGLPARQRLVKGRSVMAACGQLGVPAG